MPRREPAKPADSEQDRKRDEQEHDGDGRGAFGVLRDAMEEEDRGDLGLERQVAGDEDHRAVFADRARERHRNAREDPGQDVREHDLAERGELARAKRAGRLLELLVELDQHRLHRPDDEGERHERQGDHHCASVNVTLASLVPSDREVDRRPGAVERHDHEPGNDRRQRERQVDDRVDDRLAGERVPHEHPRDDRPEHRR